MLAAGTGADCTSVKFGCRSSNSFHPRSVSCQCLLRSDLLLRKVEVESLFDGVQNDPAPPASGISEGLGKQGWGGNSILEAKFQIQHEPRQGIA